MAYNLESLITLVQQILDPEQTYWILDHNKPQLQSLLYKVTSLKQVLEKYSGPKIEHLESQIRDAAHKAEDIIESHMADQILSRPGRAKYNFSTPDLQQVEQELDSAMEQVVKLMDGKEVSIGGASTGASFSPDPSSKSIMVGPDEDLMKLKDQLTGSQSRLRIIPIVGMGGIGKTTLARNLYNDPLIVSHFPSCGWITISQDYNVRAILLGLLSCIIGKLSDKLIEKKNEELELFLYQRLYEKRYLIVLDDMWGTNSWDDIRRCFPDTNNGSRIVLTTRESDVAKYADSQSPQHEMQLLNESKSCNLLHQEVFGHENCPVALQGMARKIASHCGGLPLAIHVIAGLLSKSDRSEGVWESISNDVRASIEESDKEFSNILSLSYNHLPSHLKPCFLHMGAFPEDYEIKTSKLIHLWVSEGFLKSNGDKSLEEEAQDYLKGLIERNLLLVAKNKSNGQPKIVGMHDLLRDLCLRKAGEEKFLYVNKWQHEEVTLHSQRRVSAHALYGLGHMYGSTDFMSLARSFLCTGPMSHVIMSPIFFALSLLRVLDVFEMKFPKFPKEILQLVHLRYLALSCDSTLPYEISRLRYLQTLIARLGRGYMPPEIWEMSELRHLKFKNTDIWIEGGYMEKFVLNKLQTITGANIFELISSRWMESIPNLKNLGILNRVTPSGEVDLRHLHKLETLKCSSDLSPEAQGFLEVLRFPCTLRKLNLVRVSISRMFLTTLCALPNLEVLKIRKCNFINQAEDEEWEAGDEDVLVSLQFLLLESLSIVRWKVDETNLPKLRRLVIRDCCELEEIPSGIGEITALELIELEKCSPSSVASLKQIQEEQSECGNCGLQLRIS